MHALEAGKVVAIPTDTVYGLACSPQVRGAVDSVFELKGRAEDKPLPVLGATLDDLGDVAVFDHRALTLARRFWPGALTLVLPRNGSFTADLGGGEKRTVAVRVPKHPLARELLATTGPLAVTSANPSGEPPAATAGEVRAYFPGLEVLDGGPSAGAPSTVLALVDRPQVLRRGEIAEAELAVDDLDAPDR